MTFEGKVVLITGAAGAIGRASALRFAQAGAVVELTDLNAQGMEESCAAVRAAGGEAGSTCGDMGDSVVVEQMVANVLRRHGHIDVFHCNAGIQGALGPIQAYAVEEYDRIMSANTRSVFVGLRHVLPGMIERRTGSVVVTCSVASLNGMPAIPAYVASKHAALGLVKAAAMDVAAFGVRVNAVCPGAVDTAMLQGVLETIAPDNPHGAAARFAANAPLGRLVQPEDIADTVFFLSSDAARSMTGASVAVDCGLSAKFGGATRAA